MGKSNKDHRVKYTMKLCKIYIIGVLNWEGAVLYSYHRGITKAPLFRRVNDEFRPAVRHFTGQYLDYIVFHVVIGVSGSM